MKKWLALWRLYNHAKQAVRQVAGTKALQLAAQSDPVLSFCPSCGQRPQDDRRKDETRALLYSIEPDAKRVDVDMVLSLAYWWLKR